MRCIDCCHPQCVAPSCKTCAICRSTKCKKKRRCKDRIAPLHPKQMPKSLAEVNSFLCGKGQFVTCVTEDADGRICGKVARPLSSHAALQSKKHAYKCGECLTAEKSQKSLAAAIARE